MNLKVRCIQILVYNPNYPKLNMTHFHHDQIPKVEPFEWTPKKKNTSQENRLKFLYFCFDKGF